MNLGVQYYRPPFPVQKYWQDDMLRIRDSGLDTLQLWVTWAWVESSPGKFCFDDYDRLIEMAGNAGLNILLSTIAELQPHWIHHEVPGSEMIDNYGHKIISSCREESNFGLTPGGCTEHPQVWHRMKGFIEQVVLRYRGLSYLVGWDAWNELRWHEQSDALVCFCPHCIAEFHSWLSLQHNGLQGLNKAWQRRYSNWAEVTPGKLPWRTFTEMMAWQHFISWKANRHGKRRYDLIKSLDPAQDVTVHAGDPSPIVSGGALAYPIDRGNDWFYADEMDGIGCSSFPKLFNMDDTAFTTRIEYVRSAARKKKIWLSELQGGRGSMGFQPTAAVSADEQQRWVWRGICSGADKILFWCWRDEIFGRESSGFGMCGNDGHAKPRLDAMAKTGAIVKEHNELLNHYRSDEPVVGVLFSPQTYYLHWSLNGHGNEARNALEGCCRALTILNIPYSVIEEEHLEQIESVNTLFLPRLLVASAKLETALVNFVRRGGTLICEAECGAFTSEGIYRYPEERFLSRSGLISGHEVGRRDLTSAKIITARLPDGKELNLPASQWITPWHTDKQVDSLVLASHRDGTLICEFKVHNESASNPQSLAQSPHVTFLNSQVDAFSQGGSADDKSTPTGTATVVATIADVQYGTCPPKTPHSDEKVRLNLGNQYTSPKVDFPQPDDRPEYMHPCPSGRVILSGSYLSEAFSKTPTTDYLQFIKYCCAQAGQQPVRICQTAANDTAVTDHAYVRLGLSNGNRIAFLFLPQGQQVADLEIDRGIFRSTKIKDIISGICYKLEDVATNRLSIRTQTHGIAVLTESD